MLSLKMNIIKKKEIILILEESGYCLFQDDYIKTLYQKQGSPFLVEILSNCDYFVLYQAFPVVTPQFVIDTKQEPVITFQMRRIHPVLVSEYVRDNNLYKYVFKGFLSLLDDIVLHYRAEVNKHVFISINPLPENYQSGNEYDTLFVPFILNLQDSVSGSPGITRFLVNSSESLIYLYTIDSILDDIDSRVLIGTYSVPFP